MNMYEILDIINKNIASGNRFISITNVSRIVCIESCHGGDPIYHRYVIDDGNFVSFNSLPEVTRKMELKRILSENPQFDKIDKLAHLFNVPNYVIINDLHAIRRESHG